MLNPEDKLSQEKTVGSELSTQKEKTVDDKQEGTPTDSEPLSEDWKSEIVSSFDLYLKHVDQRGCLTMTALAQEQDKDKAEQLLEDFFLSTIQKVSASWPTPMLKVKIATQCLDSLKNAFPQQASNDQPDLIDPEEQTRLTLALAKVKEGVRTLEATGFFGSNKVKSKMTGQDYMRKRTAPPAIKEQPIAPQAPEEEEQGIDFPAKDSSTWKQTALPFSIPRKRIEPDNEDLGEPKLAANSKQVSQPGTKPNSKKKMAKIVPWSPAEHMKFIEGVRLYGKNWGKVAEYIGPSRSRDQMASHSQSFRKKIHANSTIEGADILTMLEGPADK